MSVRLAEAAVIALHRGSMTHGPSASIPVGSTNCAWLRCGAQAADIGWPMPRVGSRLAAAACPRAA